jgi:pre-rRNA-processing protein TSR2
LLCRVVVRRCTITVFVVLWAALFNDPHGGYGGWTDLMTTDCMYVLRSIVHDSLTSITTSVNVLLSDPSPMIHSHSFIHSFLPFFFQGCRFVHNNNNNFVQSRFLGVFWVSLGPATTDSTSLFFKPPKRKTKTTMNDTTSDTQMTDEFRAGVTACLRSWSAFRTAVESGWGGNQSLTKAEELRSSIIREMLPPSRGLSVDDLEDNLAIFMEEEFSVTLEDGSERQIADTIWRMCEDCRKGDASLARQVVAEGESAVTALATFPVQIQSGEHDDDDDDEEMEESGEMQDSSDASQLVAPPTTVPSAMNARDYANQYLFGAPPEARLLVPSDGPVRQLGDTAPIEEVPAVVDDDGFAPVSKNRRKAQKPV